MKNIDARGLSCPQPMLMAKKAMEENTDDKIEILVDCSASVENVSRAAQKLGWEIKVEPLDNDASRMELSKG